MTASSVNVAKNEELLNRSDLTAECTEKVHTILPEDFDASDFTKSWDE